MRKVIGMRFPVKSLLVIAVLSVILVGLVITPVYAEAPPYGILLDDMWAMESEQLSLAFSLSPVPSYVDKGNFGPDLILTQGTKFDFYFSDEVEIIEILEWDTSGMDEHTVSGSVFKTKGDGDYTFNTPGQYVIFFHGKIMYYVEVAGNSAKPVPAAPSPTAPPSAASSGAVNVTLDGKSLSFVVPPQIINGRTLVPLRVIFEALGASVEWKDSTQTVTAVRGNTTISLRIGSNVLTKNGASVTLDVPAQLIDSRTMVPARAVAEAFGADVKWVEATQTVIITTAGTTEITGGATGGTSSGTSGSDNASGRPTQSTLAGTYWKAVSFEGEHALSLDENLWADLFLWEDGTGFLRISEATAQSHYWGMQEHAACDWRLRNGMLVLTETGSSAVELYTGTFEQARLTIAFDGFYGNSPFTIIMEQTKMPPYGAQWEIPDLFGTWSMLSYSDSDGDHDVSMRPLSARAELIIGSTQRADFNLNDDAVALIEERLEVTLKEGPIWKGCANQAWHAELTGAGDPDAKYYVTFADGKLLFMLDYVPHSDVLYPYSFSAEFEYVGFYLSD